MVFPKKASTETRYRTIPGKQVFGYWCPEKNNYQPQNPKVQLDTVVGSLEEATGPYGGLTKIHQAAEVIDGGIEEITKYVWLANAGQPGKVVFSQPLTFSAHGNSPWVFKVLAVENLGVYYGPRTKLGVPYYVSYTATLWKLTTTEGETLLATTAPYGPAWDQFVEIQRVTDRDPVT